MKIFTGVVTSTKNTKTARVAVTRTVAHSVYKKQVKRTKNYLVHDEIGSEVGQTVRFIASKPFSKMKKWALVEIVGVKKEAKEETKKEVKKIASKAKKEAPKKK
jgi:small subunit ribosomal protein S17